MSTDHIRFVPSLYSSSEEDITTFRERLIPPTINSMKFASRNIGGDELLPREVLTTSWLIAAALAFLFDRSWRNVGSST